MYIRKRIPLETRIYPFPNVEFIKGPGFNFECLLHLHRTEIVVQVNDIVEIFSFQIIDHQLQALLQVMNFVDIRIRRNDLQVIRLGEKMNFRIRHLFFKTSNDRCG